jgi:thymidylate synthase
MEINMSISNSADTQYLEVAQELLDQATLAPNRTATSAYKLFGKQLSFDLREGFPLLTTKKVHLRSIIVELLWFLKGDTNTKYLKDNNCRIWDEWATDSGNLGPVYGAQWRKWESIIIPKSKEEYHTLTSSLNYKHIGEFVNRDRKINTPVLFKQIDQIQDVLEKLKNDPLDRRMIVTAYNPAVKPTTELTPQQNAEINLQALPPCHMMFHFNATPLTTAERMALLTETLAKEIQVDNVNLSELQAYDQAKDQVQSISFDELPLYQDFKKYNIPEYYLDLQMYQRSADWFLGVPFNIASYSLLLMMFAQQSNMIARNFIHSFGDYHIYEDHIDVIKQQLKQPQHVLPNMVITKAASIDEYTIDHFELRDYVCGPLLKGKVAV